VERSNPTNFFFGKQNIAGRKRGTFEPDQILFNQRDVPSCIFRDPRFENLLRVELIGRDGPSILWCMNKTNFLFLPFGRKRITMSCCFDISIFHRMDHSCN